jgi:hypothetical protein
MFEVMCKFLREKPFADKNWMKLNNVIIVYFTLQCRTTS